MPMPTSSIPVETQHTSRRLVWHHCSPGHAALYVQLLKMSAGRRQPLQDVVNHCWTSSHFFLLCFEG